MLNHRNSKKIVNKFTIGVILTLLINSVNSQQLNTAVQVAVDTNNAAEATQKRIGTLNDQTGDLTNEYRTVINEIESLRSYNKQLEAVVVDQRQYIASINAEMTQLEQTNRDVVPMIIEMVDALNKLIEADIPFKLEERQTRVLNLETLLDQSDVTTAEKYRKVTEAYGIELDYGSTVDSYKGNLPTGKQVDFLRVGRTSLIYQTLNQEVSGWWNPNTEKFEELDRRYNDEIKEAIRIAKKSASPNLAGLPVTGAQNAGGQ